MKRTCLTPGCEKGIGDRSITHLCSGCYSYIYTNQKRSPKQLIQRAQKIELFQSRLSFILPNSSSTLLVSPGGVKKYRRRPRYKQVG